MGNEDGLTALHQSCIDNNEAMMRILVEKGADVNVTDRELWTPLHAASTCGHKHLAHFLIQKGAHLLAINSDGNMPYDICEDEETLDYIESQMATQGITQEQIDELREIVPNQMLQGMQEIYKNGGDLEIRDNVGATPLHIAVANGYEKVVQYLLSHNVDYAARDNDGWQPIHAAVCWAQTDIITMLVESGADLDARTNNDETPLSICEDDEIRSLIQQLKQEIQSNRIKPTGGLVRRSSSRNKRGSSIRRSSKREKGEMRKLDAKGEAAYMQSKTEELENSSDGSPVTNIDDVKISEETNGHIEQSEEGNTEGDENGEGGRVTPLPVITEEHPDPESPRNKKNNGDLGGDATQENGRTENGDFDETEGAHQKRLVSILKKPRSEGEGIKSQKSKKEQKEEKEKIKREQREKEKQEKQKLKEEKARKKEEMRKKEEEKKKENARPAGSQGDGMEMDDQYSSKGETLADLKRQRASQHGSPTAGGDNIAELDSDSAQSPSGSRSVRDRKWVRCRIC
ncbi:protein phosphatase 1 regulatory inhibitor subunit 16B-like isoform X2 [Lytechinus variegatus]|uniref:protein phosphatase 1 regulatory inhibitor subunit 16B-like isoform X2 n=1 Tax=Lytechinus variegatus TaxID=7654 RepID=UPI001BB1DF96|nr:protein phosphatase 1 regulatory inhibitor subunit 16B-like isoform X2 [Lytechinus variegatus]